MFAKKVLIIVIAVIGLGLMSVSLNASEMKCGAGKCGSSMSKDAKAKGCSCVNCDNENCAAKKDPSKACDCKHDDKAMKCGAGKCGKKQVKYFLFLSILLFSACQSTQEWLKTKPLSYQNGYKQGCDNGEERAENSMILEKNKTSSYKTDTQYREGWDEGYADCYSDKEFEIMTERHRRF